MRPEVVTEFFDNLLGLLKVFVVVVVVKVDNVNEVGKSHYLMSDLLRVAIELLKGNEFCLKDFK